MRQRRCRAVIALFSATLFVSAALLFWLDRHHSFRIAMAAVATGEQRARGRPVLPCRYRSRDGLRRGAPRQRARFRIDLLGRCRLLLVGGQPGLRLLEPRDGSDSGSLPVHNAFGVKVNSEARAAMLGLETKGAVFMLQRVEIASCEQGPHLEPGARVVMLDSGHHLMAEQPDELLAALAAHPQLVLSRRQLVEMVWDTAWTGDAHLVDVHIGRIRKKLGDEAAVRRRVAAVNAEIVKLTMTVVDGPSTTLSPLDVDQVVAEWRESRSTKPR